MALRMPGYAHVRQGRDSRYVFEWRADELGVLNSTGFLGLADRGERHTVTFDRSGASGFAGFTMDRWLRALEPPLAHPRWWSYDLDDDGIGEVVALLTEPGATNMVNNSYCGTGTTGWTPGGSATVTRVTVLDTGALPLLGKAGKIVSSQAGANGAVNFYADASGYFDTTAGQFYALLAVVWVPRDSVGQPWTFYIDWRNTGGSLISSSAAAFTPTRAGRHFVRVLDASPTGGTNATLRVQPGTLVAASVTLYLEQLQLVWAGGASVIPADTTQSALVTLAGETPPVFGFPELISPLGCCLYAKAVIPWGALGPTRTNCGLVCLGVKDSLDGGTFALTLTSNRQGLISRYVGATAGLATTATLPATGIVQPLEFLARQQPDGTVEVSIRDGAGTRWDSSPNPPNDRCSAHPGKVGSPYAASGLVVGGNGAGSGTVALAGGVGMLLARYTTGLAATLAEDWARMAGSA